jgi:alpha-methylacyl-CoA racemase
MGAEVVRVERPAANARPTTRAEAETETDVLARGKRSVQIDLHAGEGTEQALALAEESHILLEGFRPGVADRLGIGPAACWCRNPGLVYGRMTGWGQSGPLAAVAGHDINFLGLTGALHAIGRSGQPPSVPLFLVGDLGGGAMFLVSGVLAALHRAGQTGRGDVVDAAVVDGVSAMMAPIYQAYAAGQWVDRRGANFLDSGRPWYDVYETADSKWMAVGAIEYGFYQQMIRLLGIPAHLADRDDPAHWPALREAMTTRFKSRTRAHWEQVFAGSDACVTPVLSLAEARAHPHLAERGTFVEGPQGILPSPAPRFEESTKAR